MDAETRAALLQIKSEAEALEAIEDTSVKQAKLLNLRDRIREIERKLAE